MGHPIPFGRPQNVKWLSVISTTAADGDSRPRRQRDLQILSGRFSIQLQWSGSQLTGRPVWISSHGRTRSVCRPVDTTLNHMCNVVME
jgi:hypothetical protein